MGVDEGLAPSVTLPRRRADRGAHVPLGARGGVAPGPGRPGGGARAGGEQFGSVSSRRRPGWGQDGAGRGQDLGAGGRYDAPGVAPLTPAAEEAT